MAVSERWFKRNLTFEIYTKKRKTLFGIGKKRTFNALLKVYFLIWISSGRTREEESIH